MIEVLHDMPKGVTGIKVLMRESPWAWAAYEGAVG